MKLEQQEFLEKIYRESFNELEIYARALLQGKFESTVVVQEAFYIACVKIEDFVSSPNPIGWMKLTVKNVVRNMLRQKAREQKLFISYENIIKEPYTLASEESQLELLDQCKSMITSDEYKLIERIVLNGETYISVAKDLGISMWACYKRIERILEKLKYRIEEDQKK